MAASLRAVEGTLVSPGLLMERPSTGRDALVGSSFGIPYLLLEPRTRRGGGLLGFASKLLAERDDDGGPPAPFGPRAPTVRRSHDDTEPPFGPAQVLTEPCCDDCESGGGCGGKADRSHGPRGDEDAGGPGLLREQFFRSVPEAASESGAALLRLSPIEMLLEPEQMPGGSDGTRHLASNTSGSGSFGSENLSACDQWTGEYTDEGFFCAKEDDESGGDADIESNDVSVLKLAYDMINDNLDYIRDYFDAHSPMTSDCTEARVSGGTLFTPRSMIYESLETEAYEATNLWASRFMKFNWAWLSAYSRTRTSESWRTDAERECLVVGLARTIIHETTHSCLIGEKTAYLLDYYFCRRYLKDNALAGVAYCCCPAPLESYEAAYYDGDYKVITGSDPWTKPTLSFEADGDPVVSYTCEK